MAGKHATHSQIKQIVALREIGLTHAAIAAEVGLGTATVGRICKRFSAKKGSIRSRLVEQAREELYSRLSSDEWLMQEAKKHVADDLALTRLIREKATEVVQSLPTDDPDQAANSARALNSTASALATAQKVGRVATGTDKLAESASEVPVLQIYEMTPEDIAEMREQQLQEQEEVEGGYDSDDEEVMH